MIGAARYYAPRMFAPTYWPKLGGVGAGEAVATTITVRSEGLFGFGFTVRTDVPGSGISVRSEPLE